MGAVRRLEQYWYWPHPASPVLDMACEMAARGHALTVESLATRFGRPLGTADDATLPYRAVRDLPEVSTRPERSPSWAAERATVYLGRARRRRDTVRAGRFDVAYIHTLNRFTDPIAMRELRRHCAVAALVHDVRPHQRRLPASGERVLLQTLYRGVDHLFVAHQWLRDELCASFRVDPAKVTVLGMQIPDRFRDRPAPIERQPGAPLRVLCFGVLRRNKGIDVLIDAVASLGPDVAVRLTIAGRGADDVEALVRAAPGRDPRIEAEVGFVTEERKAELYRSSDLVVLPYTSFNSQSAVLADAYAYRVPVLVTDVGSLGPTVRGDASGWVVPPRDAAALADALGRVAAEPTCLHGPAERIDALVGDLRLSRVVDRMEDALVRLTSERDGRRR